MPRRSLQGVQVENWSDFYRRNNYRKVLPQEYVGSPDSVNDKGNGPLWYQSLLRILTKQESSKSMAMVKGGAAKSPSGSHHCHHGVHLFCGKRSQQHQASHVSQRPRRPRGQGGLLRGIKTAGGRRAPQGNIKIKDVQKHVIYSRSPSVSSK
jgi:hypothetical protein